MQTDHDSPHVESPAHHSVLVRLLRSVGFSFLPNPILMFVAVACLWLLALLFLGIRRVQTERLEWSLSDAVGCGGCIVALTLVSCVAIGHIVLMLITGWRGKRS